MPGIISRRRLAAAATLAAAPLLSAAAAAGPAAAQTPAPPAYSYVANDNGNSVTAYARDANGNATPAATITGPATGLSRPRGGVGDRRGRVRIELRRQLADQVRPES